MTLHNGAPPFSLVKNPPWWAVALTAAIANFVVARLITLAPVEGGPDRIATVMWPPMSITFALTWYYGRSAIVGATLGAFCFLLLVHIPPLFAVLTAITTVLPPAYASWQLRRNGIDDPFATPRAVAQFVLFAVFIAPLFSASAGLIAPLVAGASEIRWSGLAWLALWANGAIANSIITPVFLRFGDWREISQRKLLEFGGVVISMFAVWWCVFLSAPKTMTLPMTMLTAPFLILMAFRFNFGLVASFSLIASILSLISLRSNPYQDNQNTFFLTAAYLGMLGLSNLAIGAGSAALRATVAKLSRSEESLRGVFEQAAVGIVLFDIDADQPTFNPKFADMIGYGVGEITKEKMRLLAFPEEQAITDQLAVKMQRGEINSFRQEKRYTRKDGSVMWASLTMSLLRDKRGKDKLLIGIYEDITQRKRAEKQLEGQTRILRNLTADQSQPELLNDLALFAEELWPASHCAIFLADHKAEHLHLIAAPSWPENAHKPTAPIPIQENIAPTITAAAHKSRVICRDMLANPEYGALYPLIHAEPWRRACWAIPFTGKNNELFGVLTFYFDHPRTPTAQDDEYITMISSLAGLAVQHYRDEEKLLDSEQRFRITFEQAAVGVALLDRDSNWLQANKTFCDILGYSHDELMQLPYSKLISPEDLELTVQSVASVLSNNTSQVQIDHRYMRKNGDIIWVNSQFSVTRNSDGDIDYQIAIIKDITERKLAEKEIERLALYDYLTELPNRRLFGDRLRTAVMAAKRSGRFGAIIYIDLDNFKQLNDTYGHNAGDEFLKMVAHRLQRNLREEDTVARLGGDEFVILLQNVSDSIDTATAATTAIAEKIQSALSESFVLPNGVEHIVTSSLGITLFPKDADNAEDLLREADIAMYRVKESQRNAMRFYEPAMKAEVDSRLALERALRRALHDDEFELYLQPQYDSARKLMSCEALLRWPQPDGSFISPVEFIPVAEDTGLIVPLGEWVLRRAGQLVSSLELAGYQLTICVNVSPRQFSEPNFVERVRTILWEAGADSGRIVLEITEGVVVADFDDVRVKMHALRQMGITLSIDDFGTGHSSLAYLKLLPLHELKIDRAFVHSLPDDANDVAIVEAVLSVARHLQLEVVAEGVETAEQFEFLKQRGCHRFQGYLLAKPAPPESLFPELAKLPNRFD
ncbi:MAG: EAL domain-containing protein [Spongiibacteraceae bacterium]